MKKITFLAFLLFQTFFSIGQEMTTTINYSGVVGAETSCYFGSTQKISELDHRKIYGSGTMISTGLILWSRPLLFPDQGENYGIDFNFKAGVEYTIKAKASSNSGTSLQYAIKTDLPSGDSDCGTSSSHFNAYSGTGYSGSKGLTSTPTEYSLTTFTPTSDLYSLIIGAAGGSNSLSQTFIEKITISWEEEVIDPCDPIYIVNINPIPVNSNGFVEPNQSFTVSLQTPPPSGSTINWSSTSSYVTISNSGSATATVNVGGEFGATVNSNITVSVTLPNGCGVKTDTENFMIQQAVLEIQSGVENGGQFEEGSLHSFTFSPTPLPTGSTIDWTFSSNLRDIYGGVNSYYVNLSTTPVITETAAWVMLSITLPDGTTFTDMVNFTIIEPIPNINLLSLQYVTEYNLAGRTWSKIVALYNGNIVDNLRWEWSISSSYVNYPSSSTSPYVDYSLFYGDQRSPYLNYRACNGTGCTAWKSNSSYID